PAAMASRTFVAPVTNCPALRAMDNAPVSRSVRRRRVRPGRSSGSFTLALRLFSKAFFFTASATAFSPRLIQTPRPSALASVSGTSSPSGETTKRMSSSTGFTSRVSAHCRLSSSFRGTGRAIARLCGRPFLGRHGLRRRKILFGDPAGLEAGLQDHFLGFLAAHREILEGAVEALDLAVLALGPANEIVGRAARKILDRLDAFLAESDEHLRVEAGDLVEIVDHAELPALLVVLARDGLEVVDGALLDLRRGLLVEALDGG